MRIFSKSVHSFFDELSACLISTMGVCISCEAYMNQGITKAPKDSKYYLSLEGDSVNFHWECFDAMKAVMEDSWPTRIVFHENIPLTPTNTKSYSDHGFKKLAATNISFAFVSHYEAQIGNIRSKFGGGSENWPDVWNFARVVRNALTHNGRISITNSSAQPVSWNGYTYSYQDNDRPILFTDLGFVELILLMEEMEAYLN